MGALQSPELADSLYCTSLVALAFYSDLSMVKSISLYQDLGAESVLQHVLATCTDKKCFL